MPNKSIADSGAGRWGNRQHTAIQLWFAGWTFAIWLFVFIFIKSFSIELRLPGGGFSTSPPWQYLFVACKFDIMEISYFIDIDPNSKQSGCDFREDELLFSKQCKPMFVDEFFQTP